MKSPFFLGIQVLIQSLNLMLLLAWAWWPVEQYRYGGSYWASFGWCTVFLEWCKRINWTERRALITHVRLLWAEWRPCHHQIGRQKSVAKLKLTCSGAPCDSMWLLGWRDFPYKNLRLSQALQILPGEGGGLWMGGCSLARYGFGCLFGSISCINFKQSLLATEALGVPV